MLTSIEVLILLVCERFPHCGSVDVHALVDKADGRDSVALQYMPNRGNVTAQEIRGHNIGPRLLKVSLCEVIGQILLHGVAVMLHWLIGDTLGGEDSH